MIIVLEGLDGVGKSTLLKQTSDKLYEDYKISSYISSPTKVSPELVKIISDNDPTLSLLTKFNKVIKEHIKILESLTEYKKKYDFIFLDRSIYSAFAYIMYQEKRSYVKKNALSIILELEHSYNLKSLFLDLEESQRQERLLKRNTNFLFDLTSPENSLTIYNEFVLLQMFTNLKAIEHDEFFDLVFSLLTLEKNIITI